MQAPCQTYISLNISFLYSILQYYLSKNHTPGCKIIIQIHHLFLSLILYLKRSLRCIPMYRIIFSSLKHTKEVFHILHHCWICQESMLLLAVE